MKRIFIAAYLIMLFPFLQAYCQNNSKHYIVTNSNDTIWGTFSEEKMHQTNNQVRFRKDGLGEEINFNPGDVKAFLNADGYFISAIADIDYSPTEVSVLRESPEPEMRRDTIFMKVLFKGAATLLFFRDNDSKPHFFINKEDTLFLELINYKYLALAVNSENSSQHSKTKEELQMNVDNNKDYIKTAAKYKGILSYYFSDCAEATKEIKNLGYSEKAFLDIFNKYQGCHPEKDAVYKVQASIAKFNISVIAGLGKSKLFYVMDSDPVFTDFKYQPQLSLGAGFSIGMIGRLKGLSFNNELVVSRFHGVASVSYTNGIVANYDEAHITSLDYTLNSMIKVAIPFKTIAPYFTFGMRNTITYLTENEIIRNSTIAETTTSATMPLLEVYKHYVAGLVFGTGVNYDKLGIELRYNPQFGMDIDKRIIMSYSVSSINLLLSYRFF